MKDMYVSVKELLKELFMGGTGSQIDHTLYSSVRELYVFCNGGEPPADTLNSVIAEFGGDVLRTVDPTGKEYSDVESKRRRNVEVFGIALAGDDEGKAVFRAPNKTRAKAVGSRSGLSHRRGSLRGYRRVVHVGHANGGTDEAN